MTRKRAVTLAVILIIALIVAAISVMLAVYFSYCCEYRGGPPAFFTNVGTIAGKNREFGEPFGLAVRNGETYISDGEAGKIFRIDAAGAPVVFSDGLNTPSGIAIDQAGDLIVADSGSNTIKRVTKEGQVAAVAGIEGQRGFRDGPAGEALFNGPVGVAISTDGKIFVSDTYNDRIRVIENGQVRTLAGGSRGFADGAGSEAGFDTPLGIAVWQDDKVLVADSGNRRIRVVEPDGTTWTLAGTGEGGLLDGPLPSSGFVSPSAVVVHPDGPVFIADGNAIRVIGRRSFPLVETISDERRGFEDGGALRARFNRPSGIAFGVGGELLVADSDNQVVRAFTIRDDIASITQDEKDSLRYSAAEFRELQPPRWPYDPPAAVRDVAGTLGEIRGAITETETSVWFHNGLDIAGGYGETARFVRTEKVLDPHAAENFATSRELLRMPTIGYIHIRLGRDKDDRVFDDERFQFDTDDAGKLRDVRIPRGARFNAGDALGTLNSQNHVHLIAGRSGAEMNAIDALAFPGISDAVAPTIENITLTDENRQEIETEHVTNRIKLTGKARIIVRAFDRMDGNSDRRRLGVYRVGYQVFASKVPLSDVNWTITFDRMPPNDAVRSVYAIGSRSGATGGTIFNYIASNRVGGDGFSEAFLDAAAFDGGIYTLRVFAADYFGNTASKDINFEVVK